MHTKYILILVIAIILALGSYMLLTKKRTDTFVGDFSIDSGFYAVDKAMGGSGFLSDPIDQSG